MVQMNLTVPQAPERSGPVILSFLSLATSEASSLHEPQATRLPCVSHKECVAERGVTHLQPAETWRNAFPVPIYRPTDLDSRYPGSFVKVHYRPCFSSTNVPNAPRTPWDAPARWWPH